MPRFLGSARRGSEEDLSRTNRTLEANDPLIGYVIDRRYRIDRRVGSGGFGTVYAAWHLSLDVRVAVKVLSPDPEAGELHRSELTKRFLNEARVLTLLKHPNIVSALDLGTITLDGDERTLEVPYLVMEWCAGRTLKELVASRGPIPVAEAFDVIERLADAAGHAHAMGVVHRDIKPANVMVVEGGGTAVPRLIDFGVAKLVEPDAPLSGESSLTTRGLRAFTPAYASPEQVAGAKSGPATDVHALALLFIELVTGAPPYDGAGDPKLAVIERARPSAKRRGIDVGAFEPVIERALALRQEERFLDGLAFRDALRTAARIELGDERPMPSARRPLPVAAPQRGESLPHLDLGSPPSGETEPASSMTRPPPRGSTAPKPRRRLFVVALALAGAALLGGLGALSFGLSGVPADVPTSATLPEQVSPPAGTYCDLAEAQGRSTATVRDVDDGTVVVRAARHPAAEQKRVLEQAEASIELVPLGFAYATSGTCLVYVTGPAGAAQRVLDGSLPVSQSDVRGDTYGGPDPLGIARPAPAPWSGVPASSLGGLSRAELVHRMGAAGLVPYDAERSDGDVQWLSVSFRRGAVEGRLQYASGLYAREVLTRRVLGAKSKISWAFDGRVAVLVTGDDATKVLESMLAGLGASIVENP